MRPALIVIDMQNYFFRTEERRIGINQLIYSINQLIDLARDLDIPTFQVITLHKADKSTWNIVMKKHDFSALIEGSKEAEILPEIEVNEKHTIIVKTRQSTFIRTNFEEELKRASIDTLVICGVFTHGCVGRTAIDAYERDFNVILARDAIFSHLKNQEEAIFEVVLQEQEQLILNNDEIRSLLMDSNL
jgi:nicotinamidase-related amidase